MMWWQQSFDARKRKRLVACTEHAAMRRFLAGRFPTPSDSAMTTEYLALDLEMSGLNAKTNEILSVGYVPIVDQTIILDKARHHIINCVNADLQQTAPIHKIRHTDLENGEELSDVFNQVLSALSGRVLVLHYAPLDKVFLDTASKRLTGIKLLTPFIDTLEVERNRLRIQGKPDNARLRLADCRRRYNLPDYNAHNAAIDAIATAELWLAQLAQTGQSNAVKLSRFL